MVFGDSIKYHVVILTDGVETKIPFSRLGDAEDLFTTLNVKGYNPILIREFVSQEVVRGNG